MQVVALPYKASESLDTHAGCCFALQSPWAMHVIAFPFLSSLILCGATTHAKASFL
jgi:hypothetical protein